jgi:hypothetical protein
MKYEEDGTFKDELNALLEKSQNSPMPTIQDILATLSGKGRSLILIFLSLPFCQPLTIPGLSTPFGIVIAFLGLRMAFGKQILLPKRIASKEIASTTIQNIVEKSLHVMNKIRRFIHPRLRWICEYPFMDMIHGLLIVLLGLLLALPLPIPFSNLVTAWSIFLVSLGLLENDGVIVLVGYLASLASVIFLIALLFSIKLFF